MMAGDRDELILITPSVGERQPTVIRCGSGWMSSSNLIFGVSSAYRGSLVTGAPRWLLIRRNIADGDLAFFSTWCPAGTGIEMLVKIEGHRWAIEDSFETAKNELGLDHNETRSWHGWHRHVSLVMLAFAMMAAIRHRANIATPPKRMRRATNTSRRR